MITREAPLVIMNKTQVIKGDCATIDSTQGAAITGDVIDRLEFRQNYNAVLPFMVGVGYGTTFANKKVTQAIYLQHGDSSGGGDMATYSTDQNPRTLTFQTSAETTPMASWTTGQQRFYTADSPYGALGLKRYVRAVGTQLIAGGNTTSTADTNVIKTVLGLCFLSPDESPLADTNSTSTNT